MCIIIHCSMTHCSCEESLQTSTCLQPHIQPHLCHVLSGEMTESSSHYCRLLWRLCRSCQLTEGHVNCTHLPTDTHITRGGEEATNLLPATPEQRGAVGKDSGTQAIELGSSKLCV